MSVFCPGCNVEHNFDRDASIAPTWCPQHAPSTAGREDRRVAGNGELVGYAEAGGEANRRWCDLLHRGIRG